MIDTLAAGIFSLQFLNGQSAQGLSLAPQHQPAEALAALHLIPPRPTLVIIGGAGLMPPESLLALQPLFEQVLAPLAQELNLTVIDGGTDAGVIHLMGQARQRLGGQFPLVGVLPQGQAKLPHAPHSGAHDLEPNHTHFFLVPGTDWGSESPWLSELATQMALNAPSLTLLINGGNITLTDFQISLAAGRPVVVVVGSGRLADDIAAAMASPPPQQPDASSLQDLVQHYGPSGQLALMALTLPLDTMRDRLRRHFQVNA